MRQLLTRINSGLRDTRGHGPGPARKTKTTKETGRGWSGFIKGKLEDRARVRTARGRSRCSQLGLLPSGMAWPSAWSVGLYPPLQCLLAVTQVLEGLVARLLPGASKLYTTHSPTPPTHPRPESLPYRFVAEGTLGRLRRCRPLPPGVFVESTRRRPIDRYTPDGTRGVCAGASARRLRRPYSSE